MISQGDRYDRKVLDVWEEIRVGNGIVNHTRTPPVGVDK